MHKAKLIRDWPVQSELFNKTIISLIGFLSAGYFFYGVSFAENHFVLPFLGLPVFIGEIGLAACLFLFFVNFKQNRIFSEKRGWMLCALYMFFVLGKAGGGYAREGVLALRHAALFYYPLFCLVSYAAFRREFFNEKIKTVLIILLLVTLAARHYFRLHVFVAVVLSVVLIASLSKTRFRTLWFIVLAVFLPYKDLFFVSRAELLSISVGMLFIILSFFKIANLKRRTRGLIGLAIICCLGLAFSFVENKSNLLSFIKVREIIEAYKKDKSFINAKIASFEPAQIPAVKLFNKEAGRFQGKEYLKKYESLLGDEADRILSSGEKTAFPNETSASSIVSDSPAREVQTETSEKQSSEGKNADAELSQVPKTPNAALLLQEASLGEKIDVSLEPKVFNSGSRPLESAEDSQDQQIAVLEAVPTSSRNLEVVQQASAAQKEEFTKAQDPLEPAFESSRPPITADESLKEEMKRDGIDIDKMADIFPKEEDKYLFYLKYKVIKELFEKYPLDPSLRKGLLVGYPEVRTRVTENLEKYFHMHTIDEKVILVSRIVEDLGWEETELFKKTALELTLIRRRTLENAIANTLFRFYLWEDAFQQLLGYKAIIGMNFGHPFRSMNIEVLNRASGEWSRDGWIAMHNSYIEVIYRMGIFGVVLIIIFLKIALSAFWGFIRLKSFKGILLSAALIYWMVMAGFAVVFEIPYQAIPFWSLLGMTIAYQKGLTSSVS